MLTRAVKRLVTAPYIPQHVSFFDVLVRLGLYQNLKLCLDAGDRNSAPASPTKWVDLSGNGADFFLGTTGSAQASDPTFAGNVGGLSKENWGFNNSQFFQYDTTNETWMTNLHKAGAIGTVALWISLGSIAANNAYMATSSGVSTQVGWIFRYFSGGSAVSLTVTTGSGLAKNLGSFADTSIIVGQWHFVAFAIDEAADSLRFHLDGHSIERSGTYTTPSAAAATNTCQIGAGGGSGTIENGGRMAMLAAWDRQLTAGELVRVYQTTRSRLGV